MTDTAERATAPAEEREAGPEQPQRWLDRLPTPVFLGGLVGILAVPLVVAVGVLRQPRWYPLLDLAQTEMRIRDVGTSHTPLVGLAGRINALGYQGSHPGPLSFYSLFPFYKLFGGNAWAMQAASVTLTLTAMGLSIWITYRRGGRVAALGMAAALVLLARAYGVDRITEAWNPYMPIFWWMVFLLALWSLLCDDLPMLPIAVFAGTFCMQTHLPYLGLTLGLAGLIAACMAVSLWSRRNEPDTWSRLTRWGLPSLALLVVFWIPPIIDQLTNDPGNMTLIRETLLNSKDEPVGTGDGLQMWLSHLNIWPFVTGNHAKSGDKVDAGAMRGALLLAAWAGSAMVAWRVRAKAGQLVRLHVVVGAALALGLVSMISILGYPWSYLTLWAWGTTMLMSVAIVWTVVVAWRAPGEWARRAALPALVAVLVGGAALFTVDAAQTDAPSHRESEVLGVLSRHTTTWLHEDEERSRARYLLNWDSDALSIGAQGFGFALELERQGFDVGVPAQHRTGAVEYRVRQPADADAELLYVVGPLNIERLRRTDDAVEVAYYDPRSPAEVEESERLRDEVEASLRERGLVQLDLDGNLLATSLSEDMPEELRAKVTRMMGLGLPAAVFAVPVGVRPPPPLET